MKDAALPLAGVLQSTAPGRGLSVPRRDGLYPVEGLGLRREIDLLVTDVDGTLVDPAGRISPPVAGALESARRAGLEVCLASGRGRLLLEPMMESIGLTTPYIASGGAYLADPVNRQVIADQPIPVDSARLVAEIARRRRLGILFEGPQAILLEADAERTRRTVEKTRGLVEATGDVISHPLAQPRKITLMGDLDSLTGARREIDRLAPGLHVVFSTAVYLDITVAGCNKGTAVRQLTEYLGIPLQRTAVIGDGLNDLEMFQAAGLAIAMANASPELQAAADWIAPTNEESGVAWSLLAILGEPAP